MLTFKGGRFWDNYRTWGVPVNSSVTIQNTPPASLPRSFLQTLATASAGFYNTPRTQQTYFDITTRSYYQIDFSKFVGQFMGSHDIKMGVGTVKNVNKVNVAYPGGGYVYRVLGSAISKRPARQLRTAAQYGYYEVDDIGTRGSTAAR